MADRKSDLAFAAFFGGGKSGGGGGSVTSVNGKTGVVVLGAGDVGALPNDTQIPAAVTEQTVSGWGFTKNKGTYSKPSGGIPKNDLASDVQASLGKADTALQQHQSLTGYATETWVQNRGYQTAAEVQTAIAGKADASSVYTKTEVDQKLVGAMDYKGTKATVSELPTSGNATGDVWHIDADGSEWAWNGSAWEELGTAVDLSGYRTASAQDAIDSAQDTAIAAKYTKPSGGIPDSDIASAATWNAKGTYSKPSGGIPKTDLASAVQTSLGKADTALQSVPSGYATEAWVTGKGYQTAAQVQTAISGVRQLPVVSSSDNDKFLRVVSGAWAAATVPSAETANF